MFKIVPEDEWILHLTDQDRLNRLCEQVRPEDIIDRIIDDISPCRINSQITHCRDRTGFLRYEAEIEINKDLYDLFFHGCSGYRAQYYSGIDYGENYNKRTIRKLFPILAKLEAEHPHLSLISNSLLQSDSKITWYNSNDGLLYHGREDILKPLLWVNYWQGQPSNTIPMGYKDFMLDNCRLFVKGAFVNQHGDMHITKPNRAIELHQSGWT